MQSRSNHPFDRFFTNQNRPYYGGYQGMPGMMASPSMQGMVPYQGGMGAGMYPGMPGGSGIYPSIPGTPMYPGGIGSYPMYLGPLTYPSYPIRKRK